MTFSVLHTTPVLTMIAFVALGAVVWRHRHSMDRRLAWRLVIVTAVTALVLVGGRMIEEARLKDVIADRVHPTEDLWLTGAAWTATDGDRLMSCTVTVRRDVVLTYAELDCAVAP